MPFQTIFNVIRGLDPDALTQTQREALVDLAVLMVHADAHVSEAEMKAVDKRFEALRWESQTPKPQYIAQATARVRALGDDAARRAFMQDVADRLGAPALRKRALQKCRELAAADHEVSPQEQAVLAELEQVLGV